MSDSQEHASKRGPAKRLDSSVQIHISLISLIHCVHGVTSGIDLKTFQVLLPDSPVI